MLGSMKLALTGVIEGLDHFLTHVIDSVVVDPIVAGGWQPPLDGTKQPLEFAAPPHEYRFTNVAYDDEAKNAYEDSRLACVWGFSDSPSNTRVHSVIPTYTLVYWSRDESLYDFRSDRVVLLPLAGTIADKVQEGNVNKNWTCMRRVAEPKARKMWDKVEPDEIILRSRVLKKNINDDLGTLNSKIRKYGGRVSDNDDSLVIYEKVPSSSISGVVYARILATDSKMSVIREPSRV